MKRILWLIIVVGSVLSFMPLTAQVARNSEKFFGCILENTKRTDKDFDTYFNQVTPENSGKWGMVEVQRDVMDWSFLDFIYNYAKERDFPIKQHTFIWDLQQPTWMSSLTQTEQRDEVEEWISAFCSRYPDVAMIEPVNECTRKPAPYKEALGGNGTTGYDWVIWGFKKTRQYAPDAELILNDYDVLKSSTIRNQIISIANILKDSGLVDAIGCQSHFLEGQSAAGIQSALDQLATTGLDIYITELDIHIANDQLQLDKYKEIFPVMWHHASVKGVTLWGYKEGSMWRTDGYLLRKDGTERPALTWLKSFINNELQTPYKTHIIPGRIEAEDYDEGGQYIGWYDRTVGNASGKYRNNDVDIDATTDAGQGYKIINAGNNEWLYYTLNQVAGGTYDINFRVSCEQNTGSSIKVVFNGKNLGTVLIPETGGSEAWQTVTLANVNIVPGSSGNVLRLEMAGNPFNINYVDFVAPSAPVYSLTVENGSGDGNYIAGSVIPVKADIAPPGKMFDRWTGDTSYLTDTAEANTTVTIPSEEISVTATYKNLPLYSLVVTNGSNSGDYLEGTEITIIADNAPEGMEFDQWTGDTEYLTDIYSLSATFSMPSENISLQATYIPETTKEKYTLTTFEDAYVRSDKPSEINGLTNIGELNLRYKDPGTSTQSIRYIYLKFAIPERDSLAVIESAVLSLYGYNYPSVDTTKLEFLLAANSWNEGTLTWNNRPAFLPGVVEHPYPLISGASGLFEVDVTPLLEYFSGETVTIAIRIKSYVNGDLIKISSKENTYDDPAPTLKLTIEQPVLYTLTIENGNGGGNYPAGYSLTITANAATEGQEFDKWTGDVANMADVNSNVTTFIMPEGNASLAATYSPITGLNESSEDALLIYPNPATNELLIRSEGVMSQISAYNITGELVFCHKTDNQNLIRVNIENLRAGQYILRVSDDKGDFKVTRFVKVNTSGSK